MDDRLPGFTAFLRPRTPLDDLDEARRYEHSVRKPSSVSSPLYNDSPLKAAKRDAGASPSARPAPLRTSRYLREVDRRNILRRIQNGEKQADLAKEYQVSRAAISNLKQRRRMKDRQRAESPRTEEAEGADRLRRLRVDHSSDESASSEPLPRSHQSSLRFSLPISSSSSSFSPSERLAPLRLSSPSRPQVTRWHANVVREVRVASSAMLFTKLQFNDSAFHVAARRLMRLLLEEALSFLPTHPIEITPRSLNSEISRPGRFYGVTYARPVCAVAVGGSVGGQLLLDEFRAIEPRCEVSTITITPTRTSSGVTASLTEPPAQLTAASVLLLDATGSESGIEIISAVEALKRNGVDPQNIVVATLAAYERGFVRVADAFPRISALLTTKLECAGRSETDLVQLLQSRL